MSDQDFTEEQKEYLQGFVSGASAARLALGMPPLQPLANGDAAVAAEGEALPAGPERLHLEAQNRFLGAGKKLAAEERAKRDKPPFTIWDEIRANAEAGVFPKGSDVFLYKFYGLFYVAPAQEGYMSRLRLPNGIVKAHQLRGLADLAERYGGGYSHVTTRANLQIREIGARDPIRYLEGLFELGLTSRGSGADNIRNITGSPLAGIDPTELVDTRPLARELQVFILNKPEFFGLPRKFNIAYDGGGRIGVLDETNDIGFAARRVGDGKAVPPGVYFRLALGGITGHRDLARDVGVVLRPEECTPVAAAVLRVFLDHGDRTDRRRARMKYLLDDWGLERFLDEVETVLGYRLPRLPLERLAPRAPIDRMAHVGVHPDARDDRVYIGVALTVGRLSAAQMRLLAELADLYGDGDLRLTVWQNVILGGIARGDVDAVKARLEAGGLHWSANHLAAGLVACTGAFGCKFGLAHTKETATAVRAALGDTLELDHPVNVHLTGCPNSCAQHYIGDLGLLGTKIADADDEDAAEVEGFKVVVGGGWGEHARIGRELDIEVASAEVPAFIRRVFATFHAHRHDGETFHAFTARHDTATLNALFAPGDRR